MIQIKCIINSVLNSCTYILSNNHSNNHYLIDCGDIESVLDYISPTGIIQAVFLTHVHYDHFYGLPQLLRIFPNCKVYTNKYGIDALASSKLNLSKYQGDPIEVFGLNVLSIEDNDSVSLFDGISIKIIETPGHNPSCICYVINNHIFTGDSYMLDVPVVTKLPHANKELADKSVQKILELAIGKQVYLGHKL